MYFKNPVPEFLLQEGISGIKKEHQEKKGYRAVPHDGTRKGHGIPNQNKLADSIVEE